MSEDGQNVRCALMLWVDHASCPAQGQSCDCKIEMVDGEARIASMRTISCFASRRFSIFSQSISRTQLIVRRLN